MLEALSAATAIQIPAGPDFTENHVLGMAFDFTYSVSVPHPNPEKVPLLGAPLLLIATSDGVLRFYRFGSTTKGIQGVITAPKILPPAPCKPVSSPGWSY